MFFKEVADIFGWPVEESTELSPQTVAACKKLERQLSNEHLAKVTVLPREPDLKNTFTKTGSLALVCQFNRRPSEQALRKAHELAWNLCEGEQIIFLVSDRALKLGITLYIVFVVVWLSIG